MGRLNMSKTIIIYVLFVALIGCQTASDFKNSSRPKKTKREKIQDKYLEKMYADKCPEGIADPRCGLISDNYEIKFVEFKKQNCKGLNTKSCQNKFTASLNAQAFLRYTYANFKKIEVECTAFPGDCSTFQKIELKMLDSHNKAIISLMEIALIDNDIKDIENEAKEDEARAEIIHRATHAGQEDSKKEVNCTSTRDYFGNIHTNCR